MTLIDAIESFGIALLGSGVWAALGAWYAHKKAWWLADQRTEVDVRAVNPGSLLS